jgi:DNA mismatch repair protein MSH4
VELLLRHNRTFTDIVTSLRKFPDLDKTLSGLTVVPKNVTARTASQGIDTIIYINETIKILPDLTESLKSLVQASSSSAGTGSSSSAAARAAPAAARSAAVNPLLAAMLENCATPVMAGFRHLISQVITESTQYSKSSHEMRHQECFVLKSGINGLLDLARKTYLQAVEDIYKLAETYSTQFDVAIKVLFSSSRGYYLQVPAKMSPLPQGFTQAVLNKSSISCSTEELTSLSDRAAEAIASALTLTHELIQNLLSQIREKMDHLFRLTDSVALLDMLVSFADLVALDLNVFSRPALSESGPIVIKGGRHPIICSLPNVHHQHASASSQQLQAGGSSSFVPNDVFLNPAENFCIITGPNGAGKTVYMKQIGLIVILAQIGCFVPAKQAIVSVRSKIMSRLDNCDDPERNMSTSMAEMKGVANILNNITPTSLILVDELGRGTSNLDGK